MFQVEESDEIFDVVIRYGLYLVAVFQLVCITTVFLLTDQSNDSKVKQIFFNFYVNVINLLVKYQITT